MIITNFRQGVAERLKVDFEQLKEVGSPIVYLEISGYGSKGPFSDRSAYDIIAQSESGIMGITGTPDEHTKVGVPIGDIAAGMYGAIGILGALRERDRSQRSIKVSTNLFGALTSFLTYQSVNSQLNSESVTRMGTAHPNIVPYQSFLCSDGDWVSIAIGNDKLWKIFCTALEFTDLLENPNFSTNPKRVKNRERLITALKEKIRMYKSDKLIEILSNAGLPIGKVREISSIPNHPQIKHLSSYSNLKSNNRVIGIFSTPLEFQSYTSIPHSNPPHLNSIKHHSLESGSDIQP